MEIIICSNNGERSSSHGAMVRDFHKCEKHYVAIIMVRDLHKSVDEKHICCSKNGERSSSHGAMVRDLHKSVDEKHMLQ